eukprot:gene26517-biopygen16733
MKADDNALAQNACHRHQLSSISKLTFVTKIRSLQGHTSRTPCESHNIACSTPA